MHYYKIILLLTGGVKLRYPSCYVLVTDLDETTAALLSTPSATIKSSCLPSSGKFTFS